MMTSNRARSGAGDPGSDRGNAVSVMAATGCSYVQRNTLKVLNKAHRLLLYNADACLE